MKTSSKNAHSVIVLIVIFTILALLSSCRTQRIEYYSFVPNYVNNTISTKIITNKDTLNFGELTPEEFEAFIDYYIKQSYKHQDKITLR